MKKPKEPAPKPKPGKSKPAKGFERTLRERLEKWTGAKRRQWT